MVPVGRVEAILKCTRCLTTYRQIAPIVMLPTEQAFGPFVFMTLRPAIQLNRKQVDAWASAHYGPIVLDHYHDLE